ncbi:MAG TPA: peroxiredoxin-like family protein [Geminicoccaceae bacterium]|nr:peroxiredoxin-like family protein [Geminicoccaceae bacterium]
MLKPRQAVPALEVTTVGGAPWRLADQRPETFSMVVFYRGLHCPVCSRYVKGLADSQGEFAARGVQAIAISTDDRERAGRARQDWQLDDLAIGYGLTIDQARAWGLYISSSRGVTSVGIEEPRQFNEPGLFLVRPDGTLYWAAVQSVPFARPHFDEVLKAIDFIRAKDYPARGDA